MLACNDTLIVAVKGPDAGEPLVGDHCQGVLVGSCLGLPLEVLWGHVADSADERGHAFRDAPAEAGQAEVRQQHLTVLPQQHVFWLDIQVNHTLVMRVLQGISNLFDIGNHGIKRNQVPFRVEIAQGSSGGVVHDNVGDISLNTEIEAADNMRMLEGRHRLCFLAEPFRLLIVTGE